MPTIDPRIRLSELPHEEQIAVNNLRGARQLIHDLEREAVHVLTIHRGEYSPNEALGTVERFLPDFQRLAAGQAILQALERSPFVQQALATIEALEAEIAELEAQELAARIAHDDAARAVREAEEAARAKADKAVEADPKVREARKALEAVAV